MIFLFWKHMKTVSFYCDMFRHWKGSGRIEKNGYKINYTVWNQQIFYHFVIHNVTGFYLYQLSTNSWEIYKSI